MVFSSLIFLFIFLVIHLVVYSLVKIEYRNAVLLVSSLLFYSWGGPQYLLLLVGDTFVSWLCALMVERAQTPQRKRLFLVMACVALLGVLGVFKYLDFILGNIGSLFGVPDLVIGIVLPIGISFYTFQLISYVVDVYRGEVHAQPAFWKLLLYSSLFHQCIAGPIVRYETVQDEIDNRHVSPTDVYYGVRRFCIGVAKKAVLANSCAAVADTLLPIGSEGVFTQVTTGYWLGMVFYMLQIYLDFSAYSDMAIGLGRMVGFHYLENFNYPYMAKSVQEFWRRWHISLSSFFRDYVYIPLGGSHCSKERYVRNIIVVWFLTGMWHGASWNYILWGLYFAAFLLLEKFVIRGRLPKVPAHMYALVVVLMGWVLFRFENFGEMGAALVGMIGLAGNGFTSLEVHTLFLQNIFLLVFCIIACTNLGKWLHHRLFVAAKRNDAALLVYSVLEAVTPPVLLILAAIALSGASYNPFIYFQF
ncbi:MBOAT family protein [Adlercreutzia sp. ZJ138]|uniref:MBOAT family O-acyltransferase n=1 Tax=Adlercreutzia sp. ZJ138 TaxID=2709405 RepID=UPI0013EE0CA1|nr:MBOAT family protein [Adlercreutzia sp. ZJ138]